MFGLTDDVQSPLRDVTRQLGYRLRMAQANVWRDLVATFEPFDIRPQQYAAMARIEQVADSNLDSVAQALGLRPPNLVAMIEDLVTRGFVRRRKLRSDRRINTLYLTPSGTALLRELKAADDVHERALAEMLGEARLRMLSEDLRQLSTFSSQDEQRDLARRA